MRFTLIDGAKAQFPVYRLCRMLGVSQSGYFAWRGRLACRRQRDDMVLLAHVRSAFALSNGTYGSPRMTRELRDIGLTVGRRRIARLMRDNGLRARQRRRFKRTTDSHHAWPVAPNLLDQDFTATEPDKKWGADISYVWTREGWLYLAVVIDLFARRVVGWATGDRLHRDLALAALRKALAMRRPAAGLIHHSDRGSQYCSIDYQAELRRHGILISMSGKGNCYDNAMVETFFKTLKSELVWRTVFYTRQEADQAIGRYIDGFYNPVRRHSALDFTSPAQFEKNDRQMSQCLSTKAGQVHRRDDPRHDGSLRRAALWHHPRAPSGAMALRQWLDLRRPQDRRDRHRAQSGAVLYPGRKPGKQRHRGAAFVKTFKRDYVRVSPIPDAVAALALYR